MRRVERDNWGGYYMIPKEDNRVIFGVRPLHCYSCGYVGDMELLYIFWDKGLLADTLGERQEAFDFAPTDGDAIMASPLVQVALSGGSITDPTEELLSSFCASTAQLVWKDMLDGYSPFDILFRRLGIMVDQYVGETFSEVIYENPTFLSSSLETDEEGNEYTTTNIKRCNLDKDI